MSCATEVVPELSRRPVELKPIFSSVKVFAADLLKQEKSCSPPYAPGPGTFPVSGSLKGHCFGPTMVTQVHREQRVDERSRKLLNKLPNNARASHKQASPDHVHLCGSEFRLHESIDFF